MSEEDRKEMVEVQARAFREIALLVLRGLADQSSREFVAEVKRVMQQAAEKGG